MLAPVRQLWRGRDSIQFGTHPDQAMMLTGLPTGAVDFLGELNGTRTTTWLRTFASQVGLVPDDADAILETLTGAGLLTDHDPGRDLPTRLTRSVRRRLRPELAALRLTAGDRAGKTLSRRLRCRVVVSGEARLAVPLAALLASSGVNRQYLDLTGPATATDVLPGGLRSTDQGRPCAVAAAEAIRAVAPDLDTRGFGHRMAPDLAISAGPVGAPPDALPLPVRRAHAHLPIGVRDGVAVVGPLVIRGETACLRCVEENRTDRDRSWPALAAQLGTAPERGDDDVPADPCSAAMSMAAVSLAATQALEHLDGGQPAALSTSLEISGGDLTVRRRRWTPHPACGCITGKS